MGLAWPPKENDFWQGHRKFAPGLDSVTSSAFGGLATPPQLGWLPSHAGLPALQTAPGSFHPRPWRVFEAHWSIQKTEHKARLFEWGDRWGSNPRPSGPQPDALTD